MWAAVAQLLLYTFYSLVFVLLAIIFFAAINKELGIRRLYVRALLAAFHWGKRHLEQRTEELKQPAPDFDATILAPRQLASRGRSLRASLSLGHTDDVLSAFKAEFHLTDLFPFLMSGVQSIVQDDVTVRFNAQELPAWNLLTRNNANYTHISARVTILWAIGWLIRYLILFPLRFCLFSIGFAFISASTAGVGLMPAGRLKRAAYDFFAKLSFRILVHCFSAIITFHEPENRPHEQGICVANHTSPIDAIILSCDRSYALFGQSQGGFFGLFQRILNQAARHVWFERSENRDRMEVGRILQEHVKIEHSLPILIFPEGTCINNTSVMMFKKGSFEQDGVTIFPVAIKYNSIFGDPFWNSSKHAMLTHILMMMTSWAIVCDVYYLAPTEKKPSESAIEFAQRVKTEICLKGGFVDMEWDGQLKRSRPKPSMKNKEQEKFRDQLRKRQIEHTINED